MFFWFEQQVSGARPCPFCGSDVIKATSKEFFEAKALKTVMLSCDDCPCKMQGEPHNDYEGAFESAVEAWNRRAE